MSHICDATEHLEEHGCHAYHPEGTCAWQGRCDEPGCKAEVTTGWPTRLGGTGPNGGYRNTCHKHWLAAHPTNAPTRRTSEVPRADS